MVYVVCLVIAVLSAFTGSLIGLGGGVVLIPAMLFMHHYIDAFAWAVPQVIVGISLITMIFTACSSTIAYIKKGRVHYRIGGLLLLGSIPGGILGSWLNQFIHADSFSLYFGVLMILLSLLFFIKRKRSGNLDQSGERTAAKYISVLPAFFISLTVGVISGLFGIGGGAIMVPAMIVLFGLPIHIATATSMFMILFISIISASTHIALGHITWQYVLIFIPGALIGGTLGAKVSQLVSSNALEWVLRIVLVLVGARLIMEGLM
ncbi:sulfite exporter TauE/SafE family protein [Lentibacillus cibarius]|uniref:Probable membrane transporter protein n=1 Tax=Lentibacillus cibarius TaxID=2583219 RepID=A0A5S3QH94_9BACI|nr:sulfite exporter TauE/SafE family protein [Lentibacillus cibarius]TMN21272.1 sulfite exporter TauE/SafE family protein [Lentibacillus cibarius]